MTRIVALLLIGFLTMAGSEDFNDGASLATKGWTNVSNVANVSAAGEGATYGLESSVMTGNGTMPIAPCAGSQRLMVTWRWKRSQAHVQNHFFQLFASGSDSTLWGSTGDDWLVSMIHDSTPTVTGGQVQTSGDGGMNVWEIPTMVPPLDSTWYTYRVEIVFSSGFNLTGPDGTVLSGSYPGTDTSSGTAPGGTLDGEIRVWWGVDEASLALKYEVTGIAVPNPTKWSPPDTVLPYDGLYFAPGGVIDDITWDDFCTADTSTIPIDESTPCCADESAPTGPGGVGATMPDNPYQPLQPWISVCAGGGVVPTAADLTDSESWV